MQIDDHLLDFIFWWNSHNKYNVDDGMALR